MLEDQSAVAADIETITEAVLSGAGYQRDFPRAELPPAVPTTPPAFRPAAPSEGMRDLFEFLSGAGDIATIALWVLGAGLVIWIAVQLFQLRGPGIGRTAGAAKPRPVPRRQRGSAAAEPDTAATPLGGADALAAERRYGEAIHALLLHCVGEIARRPDNAVSDSLTGREIARRTPFSGDTRAAFRILVLGAEKSHFGGHPAAEADYQTCRREYLRVAAAMAPA